MSRYSNFDDYIADAQPFAQPLLRHLRACVHEACPGIEEQFKWSFPNFIYNGKILCNMAAFKEHVAFGFWLSKHMKDPHDLFVEGEDSGMGNFGKLKELNELPERQILLDYILEAIRLTNEGKTIAPVSKRTAKVLEAPDYMLDVLRQHPLANDTFQAFSQSHKNEYIEWITEAKTEPTRQRRLNQTIEWLSEGKSRNWKYEK